MIPKVELEIPTLALDVLTRIVRKHPKPQVDTEAAQFSAYAISNHLIFLILTSSDANIAGRHSVAISFFRNMEDALDCFGAVALIPGAAEKWAQGELKASQAARLYESKLGTIALSTGETAIDYRKNLRSYFNQYAHCTPYLIDWDIYPHFDKEDIKKLFSYELKEGIKPELKVNSGDRILSQNAYRIGDYLAAHTLEFSELIEMGYKNFLETHKELKKELKETTNKLEDAMKKRITAVYLETPPPEIRNPRFQHPDNPELIMELNLPTPTSENA
jgi:hypothetical protein